MSRVYVTHLKASTLAGQTARAKCRNTALMGNLRQRVVLVHKLGQLAGAEELFNCSRNRLSVNQVLRHQAFAFRHGQTLFNRTLNPHQTDTELVFRHFTHATHATVTQVVDVVNNALAVTNVDQGAQHFNDVVLIQSARAGDFFAADATVELHAANG